MQRRPGAKDGQIATDVLSWILQRTSEEIAELAAAGALQ